MAHRQTQSPPAPSGASRKGRMKKQASERELHRLGGTPLVLVVEVVSVLPHVHGQDGLLAIGDGVASSDRLIHHLRWNMSTRLSVHTTQSHARGPCISTLFCRSKKGSRRRALRQGVGLCARDTPACCHPKRARPIRILQYCECQPKWYDHIRSKHRLFPACSVFRPVKAHGKEDGAKQRQVRREQTEGGVAGSIELLLEFIVRTKVLLDLIRDSTGGLHFDSESAHRSGASRRRPRHVQATQDTPCTSHARCCTEEHLSISPH